MPVVNALWVLLPLAGAATIALLAAKHRCEALLVAASVISGVLVVYAIKMIAGRVRPTLWDTPSYWVASFPSGHTLVVTAFATAIVLCASRLWRGRPRSSTIRSAAVDWSGRRFAPGGGRALAYRRTGRHLHRRLCAFDHKPST